MNTILTDDEIAGIQTQVLADFRRHVQEEGRGTASPASIARAVEAAVLAKLAQQADRQRVPELVAKELERIAQDPPISGNEIAQARVLMAARSIRDFGLSGGAAVPEAPAQNGHLADDERVAALCTLSYAAGMKAGWNYCASEDNEGFERSQKSVVEAVRILKAHRATTPEAPAQASAVDERDRKDAERYQGVRCMCVLTGCRAGPGCPHYCDHCKQHIAALAQKGGE